MNAGLHIVHRPTAARPAPRGAILIVHHRGDHLPGCLEYLRLHLPSPEIAVVVVDNASPAPVADELARRFPETHFLRATENLGYAGGNNAGAAYAEWLGAPALYFLNDDTEVTAGFWEPCEAALRERGAAIAGSLIVHLDRPDVIQTVGMRIDLETLTETYHPTGGPVDETVAGELSFDSIYGAAMMVATDAFVRHHGFDTSFEHLFEEFDLCLRVRRAGGGVVCAGASIVRHKGGGSLSNARPRYSHMYYRNRVWFWRRHARATVFRRHAPARFLRHLVNQARGRDWLPGGPAHLAAAVSGIALGLLRPQPAPPSSWVRFAE